MIQRYATLRKLVFILLITCLLLWSGVRCQHIQGPVETKKEMTRLPNREGEPGKKEEEIFKKVYNLIFDNYITSLTAFKLLESALKGMQSFLGTERLFYTKTDKTLVVSSSGETIQLEDITGKTRGQKELIRIYSFIVRTNPQFDPLAISYAAMREMADVDSLSGFISPDIFKRMREETRGNFEMIGVDMGIKDGLLTVFSTMENSPASKAGILQRDQIIMIDGMPTTGLSVTERRRLLYGPVGTPLTFTIIREGFPNPKDFTLIRDVTPLVNVRYELLENNYGYIQIFRFGENTDVDFDRGLKGLREKSHGGLKGLILDLRNNRGGLLDQVVKVADLFLESGLVLSIKGRRENQKMSFYARREGTMPPYPLVVLVNEWTAAGSEMVAAALQDHGRAIILGAKTSGSGTLQTFYFLNDGSALRLTNAVWQTANGNQIENKGILPDLIIISKRDKSLSSLPMDRPKIIIDNNEEDATLRISLEILKRTSSGSFKDLTTAAREISDMEQKPQ